MLDRQGENDILRSFRRKLTTNGNRDDETNVSAIQPEKAQRPWLSETDVDQKRPQRAVTPSRQRQKTAYRECRPQEVTVDNRFPAVCRLTNTRDIDAVFANRDVYRGVRLAFYRGPISLSIATGTPSESAPKEKRLNFINVGKSTPCPETISRFCLSVSRRCGGAVRRNRIKRILREIVRHNRRRITPGYDYVIRVLCDRLDGIADISEKDFIGDFQRYFGWI